MDEPKSNQVKIEEFRSNKILKNPVKSKWMSFQILQINSLAIDGSKHHFKLRLALMAANQMGMV